MSNYHANPCRINMDAPLGGPRTPEQESQNALVWASMDHAKSVAELMAEDAACPKLGKK